MRVLQADANAAELVLKSMRNTQLQDEGSILRLDAPADTACRPQSSGEELLREVSPREAEAASPELLDEPTDEPLAVNVVEIQGEVAA
jgi:hypothetical protein